MSDTIQITARAAKTDNGLHPFQHRVLEVLADAHSPGSFAAGRRGIWKEPRHPRPVGAIARRSVVSAHLPTKILMDAQIGALRSELAARARRMHLARSGHGIPIGAINLVNYSTDSLLKFLRRMGPEAKLGKRGDLLQWFLAQDWFGHERAVVTTPDVLHLIAERKYESSKRLQQYLNAGGFSSSTNSTYTTTWPTSCLCWRRSSGNGMAGLFCFPRRRLKARSYAVCLAVFPRRRFSLSPTRSASRCRWASHL